MTRVLALSLSVLAAAGAMPASAVGPPAVTPASACTSWLQLGTSKVDRQLEGVAAMGGGRALAVGWNGSDSAPPTTRHERWNGSGWTLLSAPGDGSGTLRGIARVGTTDRALAVGSRGGRIRIESWNGSAWSVVSASRRGSLGAVSVDSNGTPWAVGERTDDGAQVPLVMRRVAGTWTTMPLPPIPGGEGVLRDVDARTPTDVWAVGRRLTASGFRPLILHWNGSAWSVVPPPAVGDSAGLLGVDGRTGSAAIAVGTRDADGDPRGLVLRWNGTSWSKVAHPGASVGLTSLTDVAHVGTEVWAVGTTDVFGDATGVVMRRAGGTWTPSLVDSPTTPLSAFARLGNGDLMAVGGALVGAGVRVAARCQP